MNKRVNAFTVSTTKQSIGLCKEHYQQMYEHIHHAAACDSCGVKPKKGEAFTRHCPSPTIVNGYLSHISNETSALTSSSTICLSCYKYFQSIVGQIKSVGEPNPVLATNDIDTVLTTLSQQIRSVRSRGNSIEFYEMVMCITAQNLATIMKADEAMLLSALYESFVNRVYIESKYYPSLRSLEEKNTPEALLSFW